MLSYRCAVIQAVLSYRLWSHADCALTQGVLSYRCAILQGVFSYRVCSHTGVLSYGVCFHTRVLSCRVYCHTGVLSYSCTLIQLCYHTECALAQVYSCTRCSHTECALVQGVLSVLCSRVVGRNRMLNRTVTRNVLPAVFGSMAGKECHRHFEVLS